MKKVFVLALTLVLGLGIFAFAGPFSGSWESELTIGFRDVVVTDPGTTITVTGGTYNVSQGLVTIPSKTVTINVQGQNIPLTVPGGTYICNGSLTIPGGTYNVTDGTVTIPAQDVTVQLPDSTATCTVPGYTLDVATFTNKVADISYPIKQMDLEYTEPTVDYVYAGTVTYDWEVQTGGETIESGTGTLDLHEVGLDQSGHVPLDGLWDCDSLCWNPWDSAHPATVTLDGEDDVNLYPVPGKHFQVNFGSWNVTVKCDDALDIGFLLIESRTATGVDQNGNTVKITLHAHPITFSVTPPTLTIEKSYAYGLFEGHLLVFEIPKTTFPVVMPDGWPWCCVDAPDPVPAPTVTIGWDNIDVYVYQVTNWELPDNWDDMTAAEQKTEIEDFFAGSYTLDKLGLAFVTIGPGTYDFADTYGTPVCTITLPFDDLEGQALLGTYFQGYTTLELPARTVTCTIAGQEVTIPIPAQQVTVSGQTVTIEDQTLNFSGEVTIPPYSTTLTVNGQSINVTVPGGTYAVSDQTVTIPDQTITIPGWSQTIEKVPTLSFTSTLIVDYTVGGWTFESKSKFDETGWTEQSFTADGTLGAFTLKSKLVFDPAGASFTYWDNTGSVSIAGVDLSGEFKLTSSGSGWKFGASGSAGDLSLSGTAYFNLDSSGNVGDSYCFCFDKVKFDASFPFACIEEVDLSVSFSDTGFDGVTFSASNAAVPGIAWLSFDFDLTFDDGVTGKSLSITPNINLGDFSCITLYYDLSTSDDLIIDGIYFYGLGLSYTWNGVTFSNTTAFDTSDPKDLVKDPYWEVFTIKSAADSCCGGAFDFSIDTYFDASSGMLFDWGESDVKVSIGLGSNYTGWMGLGVKDTGFDSWTIGFKVTW